MYYSTVDGDTFHARRLILISHATHAQVDPRNTLTLQQFVEAQQTQKQVVMELLDQLNADVRAIVLEACDVDLREFLIQNGFRKVSH